MEMRTIIAMLVWKFELLHAASGVDPCWTREGCLYSPTVLLRLGKI